MIRFDCSTCARSLEVDDELAGKQAACPFCWEINTVPAKSPPPKLPPGVSVARPAAAASASTGGARSGGAGGAGGAAGTTAGGSSREQRIETRLAALNLPSALSDEVTIEVIHPVTFRARPWAGLAVLTLIIGGVAGGILAWMSALVPLAIGAAVLAGAGCAWAGVWKIKSMSRALILTNKRALERRGLLARRTVEAAYDRILEIEIRQTFAQRVMNVGTIGLDTAAEDGNEIELDDLPGPGRIRTVIDAYRGM